VASLDAEIDSLYQAPLDRFVSARNALAKSLKGDDRVRALAKPTVVAWAVNQVYWRARAAYERLVKNGERLRTAQIAALEGKKADVAGAGAAHRQAIADAVSQAQKLAAAAGAAPDADALMRTFETLSLAATPPDRPGRLVGALQPAGFEALAGVTPAATGRAQVLGGGLRSGGQAKRSQAPAATVRMTTARASAVEKPKATDRKREREAEIARQGEMARRAEIVTAEAMLASVDVEEQRARKAWEQAHDALLAARRALFNLKSNLKSQI
jgi:hypothetical protein